MIILWINDHASFYGGCESYIYNTVSLLKQKFGIDSILLYDSKNPTDQKFLDAFKNNYPLLDLEKQLTDIPHDIVYVHQLYDDKYFEILAQAKTPVVRFYHDHWLFCLRRHMLHYFSNEPYLESPDTQSFPLPFAINRSNSWPGMQIDTHTALKHSQHLNQKLDGFIVGSNFMAKQIENNGFEKTKTQLIPLYALEVDFLPEKIERDNNLLLFVGELARGKGLDVLIEALSLAKKPYELVVIGDGRQKQSYRDLSKKLNLDSRIHFLGKLKPEEVSEWYKKVLCLVFPVRWPEPFGLVGPEAMRLGTPVIASYIGGVSDWLEPEKTGLAVPYNNPHVLAEAIDRLSSDKELVQKLSEGALTSYQEKYKPEYHLKALVDYFQKLIKRNEIKKKLPWYPLTIYGTEQVEALLNDLLMEIKSVVLHNTVLNEDCRVLVSIGGYGKSEGGIEWVDGQERPHNNLDLIFISRGKNSPDVLKRLFNEKLKAVTDKYKIEIDTSIITEKQLKHSPPFLIWYEMTKGHKYLVGDQEFIESLGMTDFKKVPKGEFYTLMINRGTLLVINDWLLRRKENLSDRERKIVIKHVMKAIIGFGDAYLFYTHRYHWSYREKQMRIRQSVDMPEKFRHLYEKAAEFRFKADYASYMQKDLIVWMCEVREQIKEIFYRCERLRLTQGKLAKGEYVDLAVKKAFKDDLWGLRSIKNKVKGLLNKPRVCLGETFLTRVRFRLLSPQQRLGIIFPFVAFDVYSDLNFLANYFGTVAQPKEVWEAYLREWGTYYDVNFFHSLDHWDKA